MLAFFRGLHMLAVLFCRLADLFRQLRLTGALACRNQKNSDFQGVVQQLEFRTGRGLIDELKLPTDTDAQLRTAVLVAEEFWNTAEGKNAGATGAAVRRPGLRVRALQACLDGQ